MPFHYPLVASLGVFYGGAYVYLLGMQLHVLDLEKLTTTVLPLPCDVFNMKKIQDKLCVISCAPHVLYQITPSWEISSPRSYPGFDITFQGFYVQFTNGNQVKYYLPATDELHETNVKTIMRSPDIWESRRIQYDIHSGQPLPRARFTLVGLPMVGRNIFVKDGPKDTQGAGIHAQWFGDRILDTSSPLAEQVGIHLDENLVRLWCGDVNPSLRYYCYRHPVTGRFSGLVCKDPSHRWVELLLQVHRRGVIIDRIILPPELGKIIASYL